jgi:hypothetical protein
MLESGKPVIKKDGIHIGNVIKKKFLESGLSTTDFSNLIACECRNVHRIFNREHSNPELLLRICKALNFDFFSVYSDYIQSGTPKEIRIELQISVPEDDWKLENICKYCKINPTRLIVPEK